MSEQNKRLIRRAVEDVWNHANFASLGDLISNDFVVHSTMPGSEIHGREGVKQFYSMLHNAFPDLHFTIEDQIAERDRVVLHWTAQGTHRGKFAGVPGGLFQIMAIDINRIVNGKVVECWTTLDPLGLLQQLGVIPGPGISEVTSPEEVERWNISKQ